MNILSVVLSGVYIVVAAVIIVVVISNKMPNYLLPVTLPFICLAFALNGKGGLIVKILGYATSSFMALCAVLVFVMFVSTFFNHEYDPVSPIILVVLGCLGMLSILSLRKVGVTN